MVLDNRGLEYNASNQASADLQKRTYPSIPAFSHSERVSLVLFPHTLIHRHLLASILHTSRAADRTGAMFTFTSRFLLHYSLLARRTADLELAFTIDPCLLNITHSSMEKMFQL